MAFQHFCQITMISFFLVSTVSVSGQNDNEFQLTQANLYVKSGNYTAAKTKYLALASYINGLKTTNTDKYLNIANQWSLTHYYLGEVDEAIQILLPCTDSSMSKCCNSNANYANALNNLAACYSDKLDFRKSDQAYRRALAIKRKLFSEQSTEFAISLQNYAELHMAQGKFSTSEFFFKTVIDILSQINETKSATYAKAINNLAGLHMNLGLYESATELFKKSIQIKRNAEIKDPASYATSLLNLGNCYYYQEKTKEAESYIIEGLSVLTDNNMSESKEYITGLANLAEVMISKKDYNSAKKLIEKSMAGFILLKQDQSSPFYLTLATYSEVLLATGEKEKSKTTLLRCLEYFKANKDKYSSEYSSIALKSAFNLLASGNTDMADELALNAFKARKEDILTNFSFLSEKEKSKFMEKNKYFINNYRRYCIQRINVGASAVNFSTELLNFQLFYKGIILSSVYSLEARINKTADTSLIRKYILWEEMRSMIPLMVNQPKFASSLKAHTSKVNQMEKEILTTLSKSDAARTDEKTDFNAIKASMAPDEMCVEIIRLPGGNLSFSYAALLFDSKSINPSFIRLPDSINLEKRFYKYYRNAILTREQDENSYESYWKEIDKLIPSGIKKVYVSQEGVYNQLNIGTFIDPKTGRYVIEKYDIEVVTNLSEVYLQTLRKIAPTNKLFVLIGRPDYTTSITGMQEGQTRSADATLIERAIPFQDLPGTEKEIKGISTLLDAKKLDKKVLMGKDATEQAIRSMNSPGVMHLATHGYFIPAKGSGDNQEALLRSGVVLANVNLAKPYDGLLTAYELVNMNLSQTELLVFSACETGLGDIMQGEGVYGLQRAARIAGARSVLMSLWTVNDQATNELMVSFYQKWLASGNKRKALREAQLDLMKKYKHPYYWGAFFMIGS